MQTTTDELTLKVLATETLYVGNATEKNLVTILENFIRYLDDVMQQAADAGYHDLSEDIFKDYIRMEKYLNQSKIGKIFDEDRNKIRLLMKHNLKLPAIWEA